MGKVNFNENDIRPVNMEKKQREMAAIDNGRLLTRLKEFILVDCPACGSSNYYKKLEKNRLEYVVCEKCETMFINPRPSQEVLEWFYKHSPNYEYWNKYIFPASENVRREKIFVPRVDKVLEFCEKYQVNYNSLLEVGSAFGTFCLEMKSRNKFQRIVAIEPTPELAHTCRTKGIDTIEKAIENIIFNEDDKFDVVATFEVIEHIFSPKDFLRKIGGSLKTGGLFFITCPNNKGFDVEVLGGLSSTLSHEHLNYFNPESLSLLLESTGFEVLESLTPGRLDAELVRNKILSGDYDVSNQHFLKKVLIDKWNELGESFQDFLAENGLSSHMWIVARYK